MSAFVLRFAEPLECSDSVREATSNSGAAQSRGTQTATKVPHESADADVHARGYRAVPVNGGRQPAPLSFLLRFREPVESDGVSRRGTRTMTRVAGEQADADFGGGDTTVVPRKARGERVSGASDPQLATKTVTCVRAEADDEDPGRRVLYVIPKCSSS